MQTWLGIVDIYFTENFLFGRSKLEYSPGTGNYVNYKVRVDISSPLDITRLQLPFALAHIVRRALGNLSPKISGGEGYHSLVSAIKNIIQNSRLHGS